MSKDFIFDYWSQQADREKYKPDASWGDACMMDLEVQGIRKYIKNGHRVLDAGCANGYSTIRMFSEHSHNFLTAFDYVPQMVAETRKRFKARPLKNVASKIYQADIREIPEKNNSFDLAYTIRVLVNLPCWDDQKKALAELMRVTRQGGTVIISEAFWGSLQKLNALRLLAGLPSLYEHEFNRYLKEQFLESHLKNLKVEYQVDRFSSLYYMGTRFIRELAGLPDGFNNEINRVFHQLSSKFNGGDFGIQKQYVLKIEK